MFGFLIPDSNIWKYVNVLCKDKRGKKKKKVNMSSDQCC